MLKEPISYYYAIATGALKGKSSQHYHVSDNEHGLFQGEQTRLFCPLSFICWGTAHLLYLRPERSSTGKQH